MRQVERETHDRELILWGSIAKGKSLCSLSCPLSDWSSATSPIYKCLSLHSARPQVHDPSDNMADLIVYALIFAAFVAVCGHVRIRSRSLNRGSLFQVFQQEKISLTSRKIPSQRTKPDNALFNTLPPSRQFALPDHIRSRSSHDSDVSSLRDQVDMCADHRSCKSTQYTPTGITLGQIKQLGKFPDYASLSGIPLPAPYPKFDIERALPRPYRPFRWNYHQTMCMYLNIRLLQSGFHTND